MGIVCFIRLNLIKVFLVHAVKGLLEDSLTHWHVDDLESSTFKRPYRHCQCKGRGFNSWLNLLDKPPFGRITLYGPPSITVALTSGGGV